MAYPSQRKLSARPDSVFRDFSTGASESTSTRGAHIPHESVTLWLGRLKAGDAAAVGPLWKRYFPRLVALARGRMAGSPRRIADEEDIALSAFDSFCRDAAAGRLPRLDDRDDVWRVLLLITGQKAIDSIRRESAARRGGDRRDAALDIAGIAGTEPTPEFAAMVAEEFRRLLDLLADNELKSLAILKMEGYTNEEIAERWACVPRTVERRLKVIRSIWAAEIGP